MNLQAKRILAILDPDLEDSRAAHRGLELARETGASLTLAVFEDHQTIVESGLLGDALTQEAIDSWREQTQGWLESVQNGLDAGEVAVDGQVIIGRPLAEKILKTVAEAGYDLVVKDSHNDPLISRAFFTPLDWHLLRRCPVPLLLARSSNQNRPRKIAAAVDPFHERGKPAELDRQILRLASALATTFGASLDVVHACQTQPLGANSPIEGPSLQFEKVREEILKHHTHALHELTDEFDIPRGQAHFVDAPARRAIADFAREQEIDLLVMGTVTRKGLTRLIMGSTAEAILGRLECDVLAIKPEGFQAS